MVSYALQTLCTVIIYQTPGSNDAEKCQNGYSSAFYIGLPRTKTPEIM